MADSRLLKCMQRQFLKVPKSNQSFHLTRGDTGQVMGSCQFRWEGASGAMVAHRKRGRSSWREADLNKNRGVKGKSNKNRHRRGRVQGVF